MLKQVRSYGITAARFSTECSSDPADAEMPLSKAKCQASGFRSTSMRLALSGVDGYC